MKSDFSQPQRQSLVGVVVMFADTLQKVVRAMWPLLLVWLFKINDINKLYFGLGFAGVLILIAVVAYLKYYNFTFQLDEDNEEFVVRHGVFNKSRVAIPLNKIQQVNINQSVIQKIIGVHALEVDTAGSAKSEVSIRAIKHDLATLLKARLLEEGYKPSGEDAKEGAYNPVASQPAKPFIKISLLSLLKTGITSNYARSFAILLAFAITVFQHVEEYLDISGYEGDPLDEYINAELLLQFTAFIVIAVLVLTLVVNLARTIIRYYDFRVTKQQNSLLLSYGLLNTKNTIIRPEKVQIVTAGRNFFQKKLDINDLKIRQASDMEANDQKKKTAIEIPGCSAPERDALLQLLLGQVPEKGVEVRPNIRKLVLGMFKSLVVPLGIFFLFAYVITPYIKEYMVFVPVYVLFVGTLVYFAYRNSRLYVSRDFIIKQSGAWDIDLEYLAPHKIQTISVTQYFWQVSSNVGLVHLHTAGGTISFGVANYTRLKELVNYWLYQVETTDKNWM